MSKPRLWVVECLFGDGPWVAMTGTTSHSQRFVRAKRRLLSAVVPGGKYRTVQYQRVEPRKKAR